MKPLLLLSFCALAGLSGCAAGRTDRTVQTERPVYQYENVDMQPGVTGQEYRDRDRAAQLPNPR